MTKPKKVLGFLGVCLAAILTYNMAFLLLGNPGAAALAKVRELGWDDQDIVVVSGKYSCTLVSWKSSLRFRSTSQPEYGVIFVEVRKPTPLHRWQLSEYEYDRK